jgi:acyl CoA:acetate/3-ketoacid CoA transferase
MRLKKVIDVEDAVAIIRDGDVVASSGYGGNGTPDELFVALEQRFLESATPRDLTLVFAGGQGDGVEKGLNHLGHEGLVRRVIGGHFGLTPRIERLIVENRIDAYNFPEGVLTHLYRDIAAGKPGTLSRVGLGTFVDPRLGGGRMNPRTVEDLVRVVEVDGDEYLFFRGFPIHVALLRGTTADPDGNVTMERETLALELAPNSVINVGVGSPDVVARIAGEEKIQDLITLTVDPGVIGGVPMGGLDFGAAVNYQALIDHCSGFDFIDGGGLDTAFLGFGECDRAGNVNASRFGARAPGCGGFINISQNSKKVVFLGPFSAGGLKTAIAGGRLTIEQDGRHRKFVDAVSQVTFSGTQAALRGQEVLYVTERCVFRLDGGELRLAEVAPGIDIERDVLRMLPFRPRLDSPALMDAAIFDPAPMQLRGRMLDIRIDDRLNYDASTNTVFMNYAGMRVRTEGDIQTILDAVDRLLAPLGKRVNSVVNYDRFTVDDDVTSAYMDAVKYVEERYYLKVSRYTNSGFMRLKLGKELESRRLSSRVFESAAEARRNPPSRG